MAFPRRIPGPFAGHYIAPGAALQGLGFRMLGLGFRVLHIMELACVFVGIRLRVLRLYYRQIS